MPDVVRTAALGANAWLVVAVWPFWSTRGSTDAALGPAALTVLVGSATTLAAGVIALARRARTPAAWLLLCGFPSLVVASLCLQPEPLVAQAFDATALVLGLVSLLAYGAGTAHAVAEPLPTIPTRHVPLPDATPIEPTSRASLLRRAVVAVTLGGAAAIAIAAPTHGGFAALERAWDAATIEGGLLTSVVGAAVAVSLVAVFLPDVLRRERTPGITPPDRALRVGASLLAATLGAVAWLVLRP